MALKLLRMTGGHLFWRQKKLMAMLVLVSFFSSTDALSGDGEDDGDEGEVCWLN
jgi:hypothetical protein